MIALLALILFPALGSVSGPATADASGLSVTSLSSQTGTTLALDSNGHLWAWGKNNSGEYGDGTKRSVAVPKRIVVEDQGVPVVFQKVVAGFNWSVALDRSGHLWSTGDNSWGQLGYGNGTITQSLVWGKLAAQDSGGADVVFKDIAAERVNGLAIDAEGQLWAWGTFSGYTPGQSLVPMKIAVTDGGTPVSFQSIDAEDENAMALDNRGAIWQINNIEFQPQNKINIAENGSPVRFKAISTGDSYNCARRPCNFSLALDDDGNLWLWGSNTKGELGDGSTTTNTTPKKLTVTDSGVPVTYTGISAGDRYALALDSGGTIWSWGFNNNGQLGDGTQTDRSVPRKINITDNGSPVTFTMIRAGFGSSQAVDSSGQRWVWGENGQGSLGDGTTARRLSPVKARFRATTSLSVSKATSTYLEPLTLSATVTGGFGMPTGVVTFKDGEAVLGSSALDANGTAVLRIAELSAGAHSLTAQYEGDRSYNASISGVIANQVNMPAAPALSVVQSPADLTNGTVTISVETIVYGTGNSLDALKWLPGDKSAADFSDAGNDILATGRFQATRSGKYTVYAKDKAGNETVEIVAVDSIPAVWLTGAALNGSSFTELEGQNQLIITGEANHIDAGDPLTLQIDLLDSQGTTVTQAVYSILSTGLHQAFRHDMTITSAQFPSGSYTARVTISDASRTPFVVTLPFTVNTTSPIIRVTMATADGKSYTNGHWTNQNVTATVYANVYVTNSLASLILSVDGSAGQAVANNSTFTVSQEGSHILTYRAADSAGHASTLDYQINIDRTPPTLVLNGPSHMTLTVGDAYVEQGATASDNVGVAGNVNISGSVDTQNPGTYTVRYNVLDVVGNAALEVIRTVTVVPAPTVPPDPPKEDTVLTDLSASPVEISVQVGQTASATITATYSNGKQANVTQHVTWNVQSPDVAAAKDGMITGLMPGSTVAQAVYGGRAVDIHVTVTGASSPGGNESPGGGNSGGNESTSGDESSGNDHSDNPAVPPDKPAAPAADLKREPFKNFVQLEKMLDYMKRAISSNRAVSFTDTASHWAANDIRLAAMLGIADGYPDGTFTPNAAVTRAEFSKLLVQTFVLTAGAQQAQFNDTAGHWAEDAIRILASNGIIQGYEDGSFRPDHRISRAEMVTMLSRIADFAAPQPGAAKTFADVPSGYWAKPVIEKAANEGLLQGVDNDRFAPDGATTRAEAIALILRTLRLNSAMSDLLNSIQP